MADNEKNIYSNKIYKKWWFWLCIIVAIFILVYVGKTIIENGKSFDKAKSSMSSISKNTTDYTKEEMQPKKELTKSEEMILKIIKLMDNKLAIDTGDYIKGDIPAGEYAFVRFNEGRYYSEEDESGNIIDNENFNSFGYVKVHEAGNIVNRGILININAFERLGVTGAKELYEIINEKENYNQAGLYKVGVDIQPGTYNIESIGNGYYAILTGPVGNNDIVNNDNFNGKATIRIKNGQYLELSKAKIML